MTSLQRFEQNGIELIIDTANNAIFYPGYNALARVCSLKSNKLITA
jgi:hypothetical protein